MILCLKLYQSTLNLNNKNSLKKCADHTHRKYRLRKSRKTNLHLEKYLHVSLDLLTEAKGSKSEKVERYNPSLLLLIRVGSLPLVPRRKNEHSR